MQRRGYTLVEILTVLGIVAVLAGLLYSVFGMVERRAGHTACAENLHGLGVALHLYANDHDGWTPPATTAESFYAPFVPTAPLQASPGVLRTALDPYVKNDAVWFCPADPYRKTNAYWLGQRHLLTSYYFLPQTEGERKAWPPRMQLGRDPLSSIPPGGMDIPLLCDAVGIPSHDSDPSLGGDSAARSNHPDDRVNAVASDLSLSRKPASFMMGTQR